MICLELLQIPDPVKKSIKVGWKNGERHQKRKSHAISKTIISVPSAVGYLASKWL